LGMVPPTSVASPAGSVFGSPVLRADTQRSVEEAVDGALGVLEELTRASGRLDRRVADDFAERLPDLFAPLARPPYDDAKDVFNTFWEVLLVVIDSAEGTVDLHRELSSESARALLVSRLKAPLRSFRFDTLLASTRDVTLRLGPIGPRHLELAAEPRGGDGALGRLRLRGRLNATNGNQAVRLLEREAFAVLGAASVLGLGVLVQRPTAGSAPLVRPPIRGLGRHWRQTWDLATVTRHFEFGPGDGTSPASLRTLERLFATSTARAVEVREACRLYLESRRLRDRGASGSIRALEVLLLGPTGGSDVVERLGDALAFRVGRGAGDRGRIRALLRTVCSGIRHEPLDGTVPPERPAPLEWWRVVEAAFSKEILDVDA
jgi:hypothetical protein